MSKYIDAEKLYKQVDSLMARYAKNEEEFEVDDEELSIFYQGKSKMCSEVLKIIDFLQQEQLPGIEDPGVPGRDFIPVEWVDACEKYGKWKIVQQEQPSLPSNLDEAAEEFSDGEWDGLHDNDGNALYTEDMIQYAYKAGAEWMAKQKEEQK